MSDVIYLDNAATSWPKPPEVRAAMDEYFGAAGGNPGRSGHRMSIAAARVIEGARERLATVVGSDDPTRVVLTKNVTEALNIAIAGLVHPGDHVVTSSIEHNSVMRPLRYLESQGAEITVVECDSTGLLDPAAVAAALRPDTRLVVTLHGSNVMGSLLPIADIAAIARAAGVPYLLDVAQTAGVIPLDAPGLGIDLVAMTGHKGLMGPTGTGGLYVRTGLDLAPLIRGGTGSRSDLEVQPEFMPDAHESGTLNVAGFAGLSAGIDHLFDRSIASVIEHERTLVARFLQAATEIDGVEVHGPESIEDRCGVISFTVAGLSPSDVGTLLDDEYAILSRTGLHCAPGAHRTIGTFPTGSVRFGVSIHTTADEIDAAVEAIAEIAAWAKQDSHA